jgi:predicted transport protein
MGKWVLNLMFSSITVRFGRLIIANIEIGWNSFKEIMETINVASVRHWGNGDYEIQIRTDADIEYIMSLVKQSLKKNKK